MKTEDEISAMRRRLLSAVHAFGTSRGFSFHEERYTPGELFKCGLGALALANAVLGLPLPDNFESIVSALETNTVTQPEQP